jgi:small GTP-binding protein
MKTMSESRQFQVPDFVMRESQNVVGGLSKTRLTGVDWLCLDIVTAMSSSPVVVFKFIIVGNSAVGKTCLLLRFDEDRFKVICDHTVGVTFSSKMVKIEGQDVKLQIWDTGGQEIFRSITRSYYRDSACAIIVYDITDKSSFDNVEEWIRDVRGLAPPDCLLVVFGNKVDLEERRAVPTDQGRDLADRNGLLFFETSAATGKNVTEAFNECITAVCTRGESSGVRAGEVKPPLAAQPRSDEGECKC